MGTTVLNNRYRINGIIDTGQKVMDNLSTLCNASGCWLTYDNHAGKWSVIINKAGTATYHFDDSNIIGPINISGTGLYNLYNGVRVSFPHEDLRNQKGYVQIDIPAEDLFPNEPTNILQIDYKVVTNPVQAQLLGFIELKQSRVDKIVTFVTDYSMIGIKAGDILSLTNSVYNFSSKLFRVVTVKEIDGSDNSIQLEITGMEYDESVYDETLLSRYTVSNENGIVAIGAIPAPTTPIVTAYELTSNPRVSATTTVQGGIVEAVEFWYTTDVPPTVNNDANRNYQLLGVVKPTNSANFSVNEEVTLEVPSLSAGEFLIKARCKNSQATSSFSQPSGILTYNAKQMTDAVGNNTAVYDANGNLLTTMGLAALLGLANDFFSGNSAAGPGGAGGGSTFLLLKVENQYLQSSIFANGGFPAIKQSFIDTYGNIEAAKKDPLGSRQYNDFSDELVVIARIVPPTDFFGNEIKPVIENANQSSLPMFVGGSEMTDSAAYGLRNPGSLSNGFDPYIFPNSWPPFYYHKMMYYWPDPLKNGFQSWDPARPGDVFGVDLGVYKLYYPTATDLEVEVRGYWRKKPVYGSYGDYFHITSIESQVTNEANIANIQAYYGSTCSSYADMPLSQIQQFLSGYEHYGAGEGLPIRVRAQIYTGAQQLINPKNVDINGDGNFESLTAIYDTPYTIGGIYKKGPGNITLPEINPTSWGSNGTGYSRGTVITNYTNEYDHGEYSTQEGQLICRFKYNFNESDYTKKPSFSGYIDDLFNPSQPISNVKVPNTWNFIRDGFGDISGIEPATYVETKGNVTLGNVIGWTINQTGIGGQGNVIVRWTYSPNNITSYKKYADIPITANTFMTSEIFQQTDPGGNIIVTPVTGFGPGIFIPADDINNTIATVSTSSVKIEISDKQFGPEGTRKFIPNFLTENTISSINPSMANVTFGYTVVEGPDYGHLQSTDAFWSVAGVFWSNATTPTPVLANVLTSTQNLWNNGSGLNGLGNWVDG